MSLAGTSTALAADSGWPIGDQFNRNSAMSHKVEQKAEGKNVIAYSCNGDYSVNTCVNLNFFFNFNFDTGSAMRPGPANATQGAGPEGRPGAQP